MKIERIKVSALMRLSKNYSHVEGFVSLDAIVEDGDNPIDVHEQLSEMVQGMLGQDIEKRIELFNETSGK